jgi:hypothetical protein
MTTPKLDTFLKVANLVVTVLVGVGVVILDNKLNTAVEKMKPSIAEETLRRETFLNAKRDAYYGAVDVMTRWIASTADRPEPGESRPTWGSRPSEPEVNLAKAKLAMCTGNQDVLIQFDSLFVESPNMIRTFGRFVELARREMWVDSHPPTGKYWYIFLNH